jgi:hypothetical protein
MDRQEYQQMPMDEDIDDDMYLPYRLTTRQPQHHPQQHQHYSHYSSSYPSPADTAARSTLSLSSSSAPLSLSSWSSWMAMALDFVTGPQFGILVAILVIFLVQWKGKLLDWYAYVRQRYYYNDIVEEEADDPMTVVDDDNDNSNNNEDDEYDMLGPRPRRRPRSFSLVVGQFLLHLGFGILDTLRIYYHLSLETVRSLVFLVQGIPLLSFSSDDGEAPTARGGPLRRSLLSNGRGRGGGGGSNNPNGLPPLWTPEEEEEKEDDGQEESRNNHRLGGPLHPPSSSSRAVAMEDDTNHHPSASSDGECSNPSKLGRQRAFTKRQGSNGTTTATTTTTTTTTPPDGPGNSYSRNGHNQAPASTRTRRTTMGGPSSSQPLSRHGDIEPAFLNDQDYPPGWLVYHPLLGVVPKEEADKYDADKWRQQQQEQSHSHSPGNDRPIFQSSITA